MYKETYDTRGRQESIFRLSGIDKWALLHIAGYRLLIFFSFAAGVSILYNMLYTGNQYVLMFGDITLAVAWLLFTPQLFQAGKAFCIMATKGIVAGRLNRSFIESEAKQKWIYSLYRPVPYAVVVVWLAAFCAMLFVWF